MKATDVMNLSSMPMASPSYPRGPYRFIDREYLIVTYESDPAAIREALPESLMPNGSNTVLYEFIRMPDSAGFGDYTESGVVIPALFNGEHVNFTAQMYLDDEPPIAGGREIWGFPKKNGNPRLSIVHDTLTGVLEYAGVIVAVASMVYKQTMQLRGGCRKDEQDPGQPQDHPGHRWLASHLPAGWLQSRRHPGQRRMVGSGAAAVARPRQCARG
jgi:acetoacetate decarboxylase